MRGYTEENSDHRISRKDFLPRRNKEFFENLNANIRRKINKASHSEFSIQIGGEELLESFYSLYSKKMYELGSLVYEKFFFKTLLETYNFGEAKIFLLRQQGKAVGTALLLSYHGFYESTWFATDKTEYKNYISDFLHWLMLKYAIEKKASVYSFGRSTSQGSVHKYKSHWPVTDIPIYQNKKTLIRNQKWLSSVWRKVPYFITKPIGSQLVKHFY